MEANEKNKVWLIVAKGDKAIYLMPVVRTSGWCGWWGGGDGNGEEGLLEKRKQAKKQVETSGVGDIAEWTKKFNSWRDREEVQDNELTKGMTSGFSITRKIEAVVFGGGAYSSVSEAEGLKRELERFQGESKDFKFTGAGRIEYLYKNAGELSFGKRTVGEHSYCSKRIAYFPLDLVVLNNSPEKVQPKVTHESNGQKITVEDKISQVIGVRLDQVVISKNGIGDGSGRLLT